MSTRSSQAEQHTEASSSPVGLEKDAPLKEVLFYALGNIEGGLANGFYGLINTLMIVVLGMNPVLLGLILGLKTFWDGLIDPVIAQISDNSRTRWGRRRPFILAGSLGRVALLVAFFVFFPRDPSIKTNAEFGTEKPVLAAGRNITPSDKSGLLDGMTNGIQVFLASDNAYHRKVAIYILVSCLLFTTLSAISSVPYYALGIEICPSYDGRTRVVTYRSVVDKITSLLAPWILPFCFLPIFHDVFEGLLWYALFVAVIGVPSVVLMVVFTRERFAASGRPKGPGVFRSIWLTAKNTHFLKILFLYQFISFTNGIFAQLGFFLTIYWVFAGNMLQGTSFSATVGAVGVVLAFASLPLVNWACRRLQKHRALRFAIIWMTIGTVMKWFLMSPAHPYWMLILPFFFSVGISSVYTILPTMMADVTDIDELRNGTRREGMFGAVMAFLMKITSSIQPILAGLVLVVSGFDVTLGSQQAPETIFRMRLMFSLVPAGLLLLALLALWRYPLTRDYIADVKARIEARKAGAETPGLASFPAT